MKQRYLKAEQLRMFEIDLRQEEKSEATVEKYLRDVSAFYRFADGREVTKELVMAWKKEMAAQEYAPRSINSMLASINGLLTFWGWQDCRVKSLRLQRQTYCTEERELTKAEYLRHFTVEAVRRGQIVVNCKNKTRTILVPGKLKKLLLNYAKQKNIRAGEIFVGRNGKPLDRSSIWRQMKALCRTAGVKETKVFPHNLRKLFARTFYGIEKDIAKLADILGHSSINTTRIYIMTTGTEHRHKIERLGLVI